MLKESITAEEIKKIFSNKSNKVKYLELLFDYTNNDELIEKSPAKIDEQIIRTWNYNVCINVIREMYQKTDQFNYLKECKVKLDTALTEWKNLQLGEFKWPFSAMGFDQHVHQLNRRTDISESEKDALISKETVLFRRIKQINALRNDYIEYLIFLNNRDVIPTFGNNRGVDFFIDGLPYDQKVAKDVGSAFKQKYGDDYRNKAINEPELVAISLYENQDEERFGDEPRLLIVYLDSDVDSNQVEMQLSKVDFRKPIPITFKYLHSNSKELEHTTKCFVVLLHR